MRENELGERQRGSGGRGSEEREEAQQRRVLEQKDGFAAVMPDAGQLGWAEGAQMQ